MKRVAKSAPRATGMSVIDRVYNRKATSTPIGKLIQEIVNEPLVLETIMEDEDWQKRQSADSLQHASRQLDRARVRADQLTQGLGADAEQVSTQRDNLSGRRPKLDDEALGEYVASHPIDGTKREVWIADAVLWFDRQIKESARAEGLKVSDDEDMVSDTTIGRGLTRLGVRWPRKKNLVSKRS